jgi:hypothetical protein
MARPAASHRQCVSESRSGAQAEGWEVGEEENDALTSAAAFPADAAQQAA